MLCYITLAYKVQLNADIKKQKKMLAVPSSLIGTHGLKLKQDYAVSTSVLGQWGFYLMSDIYFNVVTSFHSGKNSERTKTYTNGVE